jgi:hypothetical protein
MMTLQTSSFIYNHTTSAQIFVGQHALVPNKYGIKFVNMVVNIINM